MKAFAELLDRLVYTTARNGKLRLMCEYFLKAPNPDRGWALAALTDGLPLRLPVRRIVGSLMQSRCDPELYRLSRDYVGDTAETVALLWPEIPEKPAPPRLAEVIETLTLIDRARLEDQIARWLDGLDASGRFALLKLLTGGMRVGVSARLAKTALAEMSGKRLEEIEEIWHTLHPPYGPLFDWLEDRAGRPEAKGAIFFRPMMLAHPLEPEDWNDLDLDQFALEWKWDGIRVQIAGTLSPDRIQLFSRTGEDISQTFPDLIEAFRFDAVLDGELLIVRDGEVLPFQSLQQRLNRKTVTRSMLHDHPAHVRIYDALAIGGEDLRTLPFAERRERLEAWHRTTAPSRIDLSPLVPALDKRSAERLRGEMVEQGVEGLMLKRRTSPYLAGRPRGHWYKWKRDPMTADCVLMYAQRGSGKRSSFYSDFTFGAWRSSASGEPELVPVGKAYFGFTDAELKELDRFVRNNTVERFGPVRSVDPSLVLEVAFDAVQRSPRHKSGIALRFPRISRIRWDKPASEADDISTFEQLISA